MAPGIALLTFIEESSSSATTLFPFPQDTADHPLQDWVQMSLRFGQQEYRAKSVYHLIIDSPWFHEHANVL